MYYINKIVGWCLSPLGMLFLALALSWWLNVRKFAKVGKLICVLTLVLVWFLGCGVTTRLVGTFLEVDEIDESALPIADAIVLLGGGMGVHERCGRSEMYAAADRVWMAARLWKAGKAPKITLSGGQVMESTVPFLKDLGVDESTLLFFPDARNTEEESRMIASLGIRKILLVTSAWHMRRAKMMFERRGFEVVSAPTDYEMHAVAERSVEFGDFFPNADTLVRNSYAIKEWVGLLGYSIIRR